MSEQPHEPPHDHTDHVIVQRILTRPILSVQVDGNGIVHLMVGDANEEGQVEVMEDFIIVPEVAEHMGDGLFKAAQAAKPLYEQFMARQQGEEPTPE